VAFVATKFVVVAFPRLMLVASRLVKNAFVEKRLVLVAAVVTRLVTNPVPAKRLVLVALVAMRLVVVAFVAVRFVKKLDTAVSACAKRLVDVAFVATKLVVVALVKRASVTDDEATTRFCIYALVVGVSFGRTLKEEMFNKVSQTTFFWFFVTRSSID
jgi:hypothetical protein